MHQERLKANGIFLDLDGTIVDSKGAYIEAAKIAFESLEQELPNEHVALEIPRRLEKGQTIDDLINLDTKQFLRTYLQALLFGDPTENQTLSQGFRHLAGFISKS